jgi:hypothetical protein
VLTLIPTRAGQLFLKTAAGEYWRTYLYIEGARSYDVMTGAPGLQAARAFGSSRRAGYAARTRRCTKIPDFHHTRKRFEAFRAAVRNDCAGRVCILFSQRSILLFKGKRMHRSWSIYSPAGSLPYRITHNDTKLNNVLIDDQTGEGICVIDLDTVMPGRCCMTSATWCAWERDIREDEADLEQVGLDMIRFEWLARGYSMPCACCWYPPSGSCWPSPGG